MKRLLPLGFVSALLLSSSLFARSEISDLKRQAAQKARHFTVCVTNTWAGLFQRQPNRAHGTGIVAEIDTEKDFVRVFTNKHVIARNFLNAQELGVRIHHSDVEEPEVVKAKLYYQSRYLDFAVIEFKLSDLERTANFIKTAPLSKRPKVLGAGGYEQGTYVMAFGHPFDSASVSTFGDISATYRSREPQNLGQIMIQTSAPINPGNSGGPLIAFGDDDYEVVGINTAKLARQDADNVGFAIPINQAIDEYETFKKSGLNDAVLMVNDVSIIPKMVFENNKDKTLLNKILANKPDFFNLASGVLMIGSEHSRSPFKLGDVLYSANGKVIGTELFRYRKILDEHSKSHPGEPLEVEVIRDGNFEKIQVPVVSFAKIDERVSFPFTFVHGSMYGDIHASSKILTGLEGVQVYYTDARVLQAGTPMLPGTIITSVKRSSSPFVKIKSLQEFKDFLKTVETGEVIFVEAHIASLGGMPSTSLDLDSYVHLSFESKPTLLALHVREIIDDSLVSLADQFASVDLSGSTYTNPFLSGAAAKAAASRGEAVSGQELGATKLSCASDLL
jgi:S1-C subfamily serine protease